MSFILDALKKSETERQQQSSAEFAGVPTSSGNAGVPRWLWGLGVLLAINLAVLLGIMLRPDVEPSVIVPSPRIDTSAAIVDEPSFAEKVANARQATPVQEKSADVVVPNSLPVASTTPDVVSQAATPQRSAVLPTIFEVRANGTIDLPDLHLDIHVYSDIPDDRFVFINMSKHREDSRLAEGPLVEEITPEGVVLGYRGTSFLLPRD